MDNRFTGYNRKNKNRARELRKNMTPEENRLWYSFLRNHVFKFYRQRTVGQFIVDFYCSKAKLIIELDGSQHFSEKGISYDEHRTELLESYGLTVIRFSNLDIKENFPGVCMAIDLKIAELLGAITPLTAPPPPPLSEEV